MKQQVFQGCASGRNDGAVAFQGIGAFIGGGIDNIPDVCPVYHSFSGSEVFIVDTHVIVKVNRKQSGFLCRFSEGVNSNQKGRRKVVFLVVVDKGGAGMVE